MLGVFTPAAAQASARRDKSPDGVAVKIQPQRRQRSPRQFAEVGLRATVGAALLSIGLFFVAVGLMAAANKGFAVAFDLLMVGLVPSVIGIIAALDAARIWRSNSPNDVATKTQRPRRRRIT